MKLTESLYLLYVYLSIFDLHFIQCRGSADSLHDGSTHVRVVQTASSGPGAWTATGGVLTSPCAEDTQVSPAVTGMLGVGSLWGGIGVGCGGCCWQAVAWDGEMWRVAERMGTMDRHG